MFPSGSGQNNGQADHPVFFCTKNPGGWFDGSLVLLSFLRLPENVNGIPAEPAVMSDDRKTV